MLRDASHRHTIQKFSFIESLNLSRTQKHKPKDSVELNTDLAFRFQQRKTEAKSLVTQTKSNTTPAGALVTTDNTATIDANWYRATNDYSLSLAEILYATTDNSAELYPNYRQSAPKHSWGKILFALACSYCLFVLWWMFGAQSGNWWVNLMGGKSIVLSKSDVEFIDYLERSLDKIEHDLAARKASHDEVVYVPVYTPSPASPQIANNSASSGGWSNTRSSASASRPAPLPIPAPPPLPAPTRVPQTPVINTAIASQPKISHALIGVLELGEGRSAALVKVQGKTKRVWIGEEIHADGWILESVGNQRANISYQGRVRSISVGETF
ncbi:MAG: hypothetical protein AAFQ41_14570 [Cyanobacteria bacterium J06623_7]